jgi:hypothetical protein
MKVDREIYDVTSTLEGERIKMKMDENALEHLIAVLTDLYSDPELAVVREYSTNAIDSHIEAGNPNPIEVTLPTHLAPHLIIKDYGVGLSADDIRDIYSLYGASTKRDTNEQTGMLGLGSKSALTYTNQFTVVGTKDGIQTQISVSRDGDGTNTMTLLDESPTTEPNGVEVMIPVKDVRSMIETAKDFYRFWKPGTVLVNGEEPAHIDGIWISDDMVLTKDVRESVVVMGNVPYSVGEHGFMQVAGYSTVAFVEIGSVNFTPHREDLAMTRKTKETLEVLKERFKSERNAAVQRHITEAPSRVEAVRRTWQMRDLIGKDFKPKYQGRPVLTAWNAQSAEWFLVAQREKGWREKGWNRGRYIDASTWLDAVWFTGFSADKLTPTMRLKMEQWIDQNGTDARRFICVEKVPRALRKWIDRKNVYRWEEVKAQVLPKAAKQATTPSGRLAGSYDFYVYDNGTASRKYGEPADNIDQRYPIFWSDPTDESYQRAVLQKFYDNFTLVTITKNRIAKFERMFPNAENAQAHVQKLREEWVEKLSPDTLNALLLERDGSDGLLNKMDPAKVSDPVLVKTINSLQNLNGEAKIYHYFNEASGWTSDWRGRMSVDVLKDKTPEDPLEQYVLVEAIGSYIPSTKLDTTLDHLYTYINAVYTANQKGTN